MKMSSGTGWNWYVFCVVAMVTYTSIPCLCVDIRFCSWIGNKNKRFSETYQLIQPVINVTYDYMLFKKAGHSGHTKAWIVFARWNTGIVGSNPARGMDVCVRLFCVCAVLCVQIATLRWTDPP
jgi:hypothetical protein